MSELVICSLCKAKILYPEMSIKRGLKYICGNCIQLTKETRGAGIN